MSPFGSLSRCRWVFSFRFFFSLLLLDEESRGNKNCSLLTGSDSWHDSSLRGNIFAGNLRRCSSSRTKWKWNTKKVWHKLPAFQFRTSEWTSNCSTSLPLRSKRSNKQNDHPTVYEKNHERVTSFLSSLFFRVIGWVDHRLRRRLINNHYERTTRLESNKELIEFPVIDTHTVRRPKVTIIAQRHETSASLQSSGDQEIDKTKRSEQENRALRWLLCFRQS